MPTKIQWALGRIWKVYRHNGAVRFWMHQVLDLLQIPCEKN